MKPVERTFLERAIDGFVSKISPQAGLARLIAREKLHYFQYESARNGRERGIAPSLQTSESCRNQFDRIELTKHARDLVQNFGFAKSILLKIQTYTSGSLRYQARTGDESVDQEIEDYWNNWCRVCDITGRHTFRELVGLALASTIVDGDMGFVVVKDENKRMWLQAIEADRIGCPYEGITTPNYFGGITVNAHGRPTSFRIYDRTPEGRYENPKEVPADAFIHLFDPFRLDQYRGVTAFHAGIATMRDVHEIIEFEKMAVKWASAQAGVITTEAGSPDSTLNYDETAQDRNGNALRTEQIEPATLHQLNPGESVEVFKHDRPGDAFNGFIPMLIRNVALSMNLPYGFVYDMAQLGGPGARLESAQAQRCFQRWQLILEDKALNRIKNLVLANGMEAGDIPRIKTWNRGKWMYPAHPTIDVGRESAANLNENRQGLKTAADIFAEQGQDWQEEHEQLAKEAANITRLAEEYGVPIEMIQLKTPNPPAQAFNGGADEEAPVVKKKKPTKSKKKKRSD